MTKIVLPKVLQKFEKTPNWTRWPKELNQKGFPRKVQYRTRPKGPALDFFGTVRLFSKNCFHQRVPLFIFLEFCNKIDVEKSQRVLPSSFFIDDHTIHCLFFHQICNSLRIRVLTSLIFCVNR